MEKLISDKEYFLTKLLNKIYNNEDYNRKFLNEIDFLKIKNKNVHRKNKILAKEIWKKLPECLKDIYTYNFKKYKIGEICSEFKYDTSFMDLS